MKRRKNMLRRIAAGLLAGVLVLTAQMPMYAYATEAANEAEISETVEGGY